ncbi:hypothetical protein ACVILH_006509 [Bradyrhizobium sp. USDA 4353]
MRPGDADRQPLGGSRGRRECRALAATHGPPAAKKQAAVTTGSAELRHSLRDGLHAYIVISSVYGSLATVAVGIIARQLGASVAAPGPHDFASANCRSSAHGYALRQASGHRLPASHVVTIAIRPSWRSRMEAVEHIFWKSESEIFMIAAICRLGHHPLGLQSDAPAMIRKSAMSLPVVRVSILRCPPDKFATMQAMNVATIATRASPAQPPAYHHVRQSCVFQIRTESCGTNANDCTPAVRRHERNPSRGLHNLRSDIHDRLQPSAPRAARDNPLQQTRCQ